MEKKRAKRNPKVKVSERLRSFFSYAHIGGVPGSIIDEVKLLEAENKELEDRVCELEEELQWAEEDEKEKVVKKKKVVVVSGGVTRTFKADRFVVHGEKLALRKDSESITKNNDTVAMFEHWEGAWIEGVKE